jgi:Flp pilus assembly secretin CpaC
LNFDAAKAKGDPASGLLLCESQFPGEGFGVVKQFLFMKAVVAVVLILAGVFGFMFARERQALKATEAELAELRAQKEAVAEQAGELQKAPGQVNAAEVERLKADQREAIRLRGEVASLKREVEEAKAQAAREENAAARLKRFQQDRKDLSQQNGASGAALEPGQVFSAQASTSLAPGRSLVMGGWETSPGKKTYAIVTPTITEGGTNSLTIDAKWVAMPAEVAEKYAAWLTADPTAQTPEQVAALLNALRNSGQVDFLAAPRLTTLSGQRGRISAGGQYGPQVDFQPTLSADGTEIQINVDAKAPVVPPQQQQQGVPIAK